MSNLEGYDELTAELKKILPFTALPTRKLTQICRKKGQEVTLNTELTITNILNTDFISGILCVFSLDNKEIIACALTHLRFTSKNPLFKEITQYQIKREKKLQKMNK